MFVARADVTRIRILNDLVRPYCRARVEAERKMRQWQDASLAANADMEREREQREELEIRVQELTRREEELRHEMEDTLRQERERYRGGMETMRKEGRGPAYIRASGKLVRYRVADLRAWMAQHRVEPGEVAE